MSQTLYNIAIQSYHLAIKIAALWQPKAKAWLAGRENWRSHLKDTYHAPPQSVIWFHCASLGEFEQGRPLMELIKQKQPQQKILLTFFSPSGYEIRKNYQGVDYVYYLPLDTPKNALDFLQLTKPKLAIFVKYEFWVHFLTALHQQDIPTYLIGAIFRPNQYFFKWYGKSFVSILKYFTHIFVQNDSSKKLLEQQEITKVSVTGDPRIDRVFQISQKKSPFPIIASFKKEQPLVILGSIHSKDIALWSSFIKENTFWKILIAPHEVQPMAIQQLQNALPLPSLCYTQIKKESFHSEDAILIVDTIGILNQLYQYADVVYIGGGFDEGIHNTLEPAVFGVPILIGPKHEKFEEAIKMVQGGGMKLAQTTTGIQEVMQQLQEETARNQLGKTNKRYIENNKGGTEGIYSKLFSK